MKKTITSLFIAAAFSGAMAQTTVVADFESFTLGTDTFYDAHSSTSWQTANATFRYFWDTSFGGFWSAGFSYTNKNNTTNGTYHNDHAAITGKGYNNSDKYVAAWAGYNSDQMRIVLAAPEQTVSGFYATNTTYGYSVMANGGGPARKFGDTLHTHSGLMPGDYPDWFKLSIHGYKNGVKKQDSVEFYLADFRFSNNAQDYIVNTWKWVDCSSLGAVDSIVMNMFSSDAGAFGINNPTYFAMDNFTTIQPAYTGIKEQQSNNLVAAYPNPCNSLLNLRLKNVSSAEPARVNVTDLSGKSVHAETVAESSVSIDLSDLQPSIYFLEVSANGTKTVKKIIKY